MSGRCRIRLDECGVSAGDAQRIDIATVQPVVTAADSDDRDDSLRTGMLSANEHPVLEDVPRLLLSPVGGLRGGCLTGPKTERAGWLGRVVEAGDDQDDLAVPRMA